jgi:hypothetical protein
MRTDCHHRGDATCQFRSTRRVSLSLNTARVGFALNTTLTFSSSVRSVPVLQQSNFYIEKSKWNKLLHNPKNQESYLYLVNSQQKKLALRSDASLSVPSPQTVQRRTGAP